MEVHHHAHPSTSSGHRRKWTHYFWEFLMLFLAVFCGFLAEYQLEHKIEKDRGKQFIRSMYEDLKMDTAALNAIIQNRQKRNEILDSIFFLIDSSGNRTSDLYYHARHITRTAPILFINNDRTMHQLKYSGGLRLIKNKLVSDSIMMYDKQVRLVIDRQETEVAHVRDCLPYCYRIFDGRVFAGMVDMNNAISRLDINPPLLKYAGQDLDIFLGYCHAIKAINIGNNTHTRTLKEKAGRLIEILKREYHLE
jgi:hypothetical protein